jgi:hypothetical protein
MRARHRGCGVSLRQRARRDAKKCGNKILDKAGLGEFSSHEGTMQQHNIIRDFQRVGEVVSNVFWWGVLPVALFVGVMKFTPPQAPSTPHAAAVVTTATSPRP